MTNSSYSIMNLKKEARKIAIVVLLTCLSVATKAQTAEAIMQGLRKKLEKINSYEATGQMKTNVAFIKAPVSAVKIYYRKPDQLRIVNETGISFIPRGSVNINLNSLILDTENFDIIDAGKDSSGLRVIRLLPKNDTADIVLSTLYVDEKNLLIRRSKTTTRENGTYEVAMTYGKYSQYGLPDKTVFSFTTKDYKLPKGITLDYDAGSKKNQERLTNNKGMVEITYTGYILNKAK